MPISSWTEAVFVFCRILFCFFALRTIQQIPVTVCNCCLVLSHSSNINNNWLTSSLSVTQRRVLSDKRDTN